MPSNTITIVPSVRARRLVARTFAGSDVAKRRSHARRRVLMICVFVLVVLLCLAWTLWLLLLTLSPNDTMNRVMRTHAFDHGSFWLVIDPPPGIVGAGVAGFGAVALAYLVVLRECWVVCRTASRRVSAEARTRSPSGKRTAQTIREGTLLDIIHEDSHWRRRFNVLIKVTELALQWVFLTQLLEGGMPVPLVALFATLVALNALAAAAMVAFPSEGLGLMHMVTDTTFDFLIAIGYPIAVVSYGLVHFNFDDETMALNNRIFPPNAFECSASVLADPAEVAVIRRSFDSLRIRSVLDIFTHVGVNFALAFHLLKLARRGAISSTTTHCPNVYPTARKRLAAVFVAIALSLAIFTAQSIRMSAAACAPHPECAQHAHRWLALDRSNLAQCPCIALIERNLYVRSWEQWMHPAEITTKVDQLASAGYLQTLQLVNRALPTLPETLRRCTKLSHIALVYTATTVLPVWMRQFTHLEYLHIEGRLDGESLREMPQDLFDKMPSLAFLHISQHRIQRLPSFDGLVGLKALTLPVLPLLNELPSFQHLQNVERMLLALLPLVETLPDFEPLKDLVSLSGADRGTYCCNGFLAGHCDLEHPMCQAHPVWGTPPATCLPPERQASPATVAAFTRFNQSICVGGIEPSLYFTAGPTEDGMRQCGGVMYRQCAIPGFEGLSICNNRRWMAVSCVVDPYTIAMRREQIARGIGLRCDPAFEAWLGCP